MSKTLRNILITFLVMAVICFIFWKISWIGGSDDVLTLFLIAAVVIAVHVVKDTIISYIKAKHR